MVLHYLFTLCDIYTGETRGQSTLIKGITHSLKQVVYIALLWVHYCDPGVYVTTLSVVEQAAMCETVFIHQSCRLKSTNQRGYKKKKTFFRRFLYLFSAFLLLYE